MAFLKAINSSYINRNAVENLIYYIDTRSEMTGGWGVSMASPDAVISEFKAVKRFWNKEGGRQIKHFIFSWDNQKYRFGIQQMQYLASRVTLCFQLRYQVFWGIHLDTDKPHVHIAVNTVSYVDGKMMCIGYEDLHRLILDVEKLFIEAIEDLQSAQKNMISNYQSKN